LELKGNNNTIKSEANDLKMKNLSVVGNNTELNFKNGKINIDDLELKGNNNTIKSKANDFKMKNLSVSGNNIDIKSKINDLKIENLSVSGVNTDIYKATIDSLKISGTHNCFEDCSY